MDNHGQNNPTIWQSIITNKGSVQHLQFLSNHEKDVFKTAQELDQTWLVQHAADRQKYICQGQSVNLFFPAGSEKAHVNKVHLMAWREGLKGLYYLRTEAKSRAENVSEKVERIALQDDQSSVVYGKKDCPFCVMAKEELQLRGIQFEWVDLQEIGKTAAQVTGRDVKTVPQIYIQGKYVGGYDELMSFFEQPQVTESDECRACEG